MNRIFLGGGNNLKGVSDSMGSIFYKGNNNNNNNNNVRNHGLYSGKSEMQFIEVWDYMGGASFRGFVAEKVGRGRVEKTLFLFFENVEGTQLKHGYAFLFRFCAIMLISNDSLIALIELATECFNCDRLVICLDRKTDGLRMLPFFSFFFLFFQYRFLISTDNLIRDFGWVGFELITLAHWLPSPSINSETSSIRSDSFSSNSSGRSGSFSSISSNSSSSSLDDDVTSEKWIFVGMEL